MHISHCVLPARKFMSRILTALRAAPEAGTVQVNCELRRDFLWFVDYASASNGRLLLEPDLPTMRIECDACLQGAGGFSDSQYYSLLFSQGKKEGRHISQLEAINIVVALKTLIPKDMTSHRILLTTDNTPSVYALNSGRTRDYILAACSRELWLIAALQHLSIIIEHAPGATLILADALSRRHMSQTHEDTGQRLTRLYYIVYTPPVHLKNVVTSWL